MNAQVYVKENFADMDSMHDSYATQILINDKKLTVIYDNLNDPDKGVIGRDGLPYYKNKKLTVEYEIESFCDAKFIKKNKYKFIDLFKKTNEFYKLTNNCMFMSYKYAIDSFKETTLFFTINGKSKYWNLEINMDASKITYYWE